MKALNIIQDLAAKKYHPIYFLCGEEPFYIDQITDFIESNVLNEAEKAFNQMILYGKETTFSQIIDNARLYPMMSDKRVLIVKEAQELPDLQMLESYFNKPSPQTILVFAYKYKKLDGRKSISKTIKAKSIFFESKAVRDYEMPSWIENHIAEIGFSFDRGVPELLADYLGNDLIKVHNELLKLTIGLEPNTPIDLGRVEERIGISKEYNIFELQKALATRDKKKIYRMLFYIRSNMKKNPIQMIIGSLFSYFSKVMIAHSNSGMSDQNLFKVLGIPNPYFVKEYRMAARNYSMGQIVGIFHLLKIFDGRSKGMDNRNESNEALVTELVYQILHMEEGRRSGNN